MSGSGGRRAAGSEETPTPARIQEGPQELTAR